MRFYCLSIIMYVILLAKQIMFAENTAITKLVLQSSTAADIILSAGKLVRLSS